jgi:hypothetical protein
MNTSIRAASTIWSDSLSMGEDYYWKIDYYDRSLKFGSPDSADPSIAIRILTIMRVDEY